MIRANMTTLGATQVEIVESGVERFLTGAPRRYDIVFIDPPYADPVDDVLARLATDGWLAEGAVVCAERATRDGGLSWPAGVEALRSRRYGDSTLWYGRAS